MTSSDTQRVSDPILARMKGALEEMLLTDQDISARSLVRRVHPILKNASDVTRVALRRELLDMYKVKQLDLRNLARRLDGASKPRLIQSIAAKDGEIASLKADREILIASHKAMVLAVGEVGGIKAWLKFFEGYQQALERLSALGATPTVSKGRWSHE